MTVSRPVWCAMCMMAIFSDIVVIPCTTLVNMPLYAAINALNHDLAYTMDPFTALRWMDPGHSKMLQCADDMHAGCFGGTVFVTSWGGLHMYSLLQAVIHESLCMPLTSCAFCLAD